VGLNPRVTVIVPVLNEAKGRLAEVLLRVSNADEVIVVDGGSKDATSQIAAEAGATLLFASPGRASQMNAGAAIAQSEWLLFLHADVLLPPDWRQRLNSELNSESNANQPRKWGRFNVRFSTSSETGLFERCVLVCIAWFMNTRSRLTGISTGDQVQFFERIAFVTCGCFPNQLLMEDIEISKQAGRKIGSPINLRAVVDVSPRRWQDKGYARTIWLMWKLRLQYWQGASAEHLHAIYYAKTP
jgi:rSAM/selenodomain-associated transferase 2